MKKTVKFIVVYVQSIPFINICIWYRNLLSNFLKEFIVKFNRKKVAHPGFHRSLRIQGSSVSRLT